MMLKKQIAFQLCEIAQKEFGMVPESFVVEHPADPTHGDYASNIAMVLAKEINKNPMEIAERIITNYELRLPAGKAGITNYDKVKVAAPGFINFWLSKEFLLSQLHEVLKKKDSFGKSQVGKGKTVIIDYSSPNIARPFSIGHLRSTIIGQAVYNLYRFLGYKVIGDNHIGDWGTQFGKLIYAINAWSDTSKLSSMTVQDLVSLYIRFHEEAKKNPSLDEKARLWFKRLEEGDKKTEEIWQQCVDISWKEFYRIYKILDIQIDYAFGESFYKDKMTAVIDKAKDLGITKESEGALIIEVGNGMPPVLLLKSDGATTYHTRDLTTIKFRQERFGPVDEMIYETGVDHALHFRQLFTAARKFNWGKNVKYTHVGHGMMRLSSGRMRTRKGEVILLEKVLNEAIERARKIVERNNANLSEIEKDKIAKAVGIGAVKYNDLSQHYSKDIVFDWQKILNLQGNSGPYLQYAYARTQSVIRNSELRTPAEGEARQKRQNSKPQLKIQNYQIKKEEATILRTIYKFPEIVAEAAKNYAPNLICNFLFDLGQKFNRFYEKLPIIKAESGEARDLRLALTATTGQIIKQGLYLLGIDVPEKM